MKLLGIVFAIALIALVGYMVCSAGSNVVSHAHAQSATWEDLSK